MWTEEWVEVWAEKGEQQFRCLVDVSVHCQLINRQMTLNLSLYRPKEADE